MHIHNGYIKQGWYIKANQAWSFKYICKGWLLVSLSDCPGTFAKAMGKILWPSARAMGTSITPICKSDEKEKVLSPFARAIEKDKVLSPFARAMEKGIVSIFTCHICRIMKIMETSHLQKKCHVMSCSISYTSHLHICTFGKMNNKASNW